MIKRENAIAIGIGAAGVIAAGMVLLLGRDKQSGPCVLRAMRCVLGSHEGAEPFDSMVRGYWQKGYGTTCAVIANAALSKCGIADENLNRGQGFTPGNHIAPIVALAKKRGAYVENPAMATLEPGDMIYLETPGNPSGWHVGFVEHNEFPKTITTLDGGQTDALGRQSVSRVKRQIFGGTLLGPLPRNVKFAIQTDRLKHA